MPQRNNRFIEMETKPDEKSRVWVEEKRKERKKRTRKKKNKRMQPKRFQDMQSHECRVMDICTPDYTVFHTVLPEDMMHAMSQKDSLSLQA